MVGTSFQKVTRGRREVRGEGNINTKRREGRDREKSPRTTEWIPEWELDFSEGEVRETTARIKRNKTLEEDKLIVDEFFREMPKETKSGDTERDVEKRSYSRRLEKCNNHI